MWSGVAGALLYIAMGMVSVTTATVFPQDPWGSPPTFAGAMHMILSGAIGILSLLAISLIGLWFNRRGMFPGFGTYSFITVGASLMAAGFFAASVGTPIMGLAERIAALAGFQWTFLFALLIFSSSRRPAHTL
jgi:hypothetical protein